MLDSFWSHARAQMLLDPNVVNLNTGSFGPLPRPVFEQVTALRQRLAAEPMDFLLREMSPLLWQTREHLASYLGGQPHRLVFTANVTASINIAASALRLAVPGEVLLTDQEYGAMHWCWERAAARQGLTLRTFPLPTLPRSPEEIVHAACAAFTSRTRLFFFSHVLSPTGMVLPARELCMEARRRGILTVIDGAHAPAFIPLHLDELGCDVYGANCHKWMLAPTGSGFLYLGAGSEDRLQPLQVSWGWHHDRRRLDERDEVGSTPRLRALEFEGTRDPCPWLTVPCAIDFQAALGWERIHQRIDELTGYVRERLTGLHGLTLATPAEARLHGAMTAFEIPNPTDAAALRAGLWRDHRIELNVIERVGRNLLVRVSTWWYNAEHEVDRLAKALADLLPRCRTS